MALNAYRQLGGNNQALGKNLEKLASGYRINRAGDDAAGLAISEKMRAQIKGLETASKNAQDGISLIQTAEGALAEVHSMLNRMVELATQSANGIYDDAIDRKALDDEFQQLKEEIDRISKATNFNGMNLLDGTLSAGGLGKAGGANKISADLANILSFSQSAPVPAKQAIYEISGTHAAAFFEALGISTPTSTNTGDILAALGLSSGDYDVLDASGLVTDAFGAVDVGTSDPFLGDVTTGLVIVAKKAGVDPNAQKITTAALGIPGANGSGFYERQVGTDSYRELALIVNNDFVADTPLIGKTFTVNGKTYQFTGQNDVNENDQKILLSGEKLANGNYAVHLPSDYTSGNVATAIAAAINNVEYNAPTQTSTGTGSVPTISSGVPSSYPLAMIGKGNQHPNPNTALTNWITFNVKDPIWKGGVGGTSGGGLNLQIGDTGDEYNIISVSVEDMSSKGLGIANLNIASYDAAKAAIGTVAQQGDPGTIKGALNLVSSQRGVLGALQNRLEHSINNLGVTMENVTAAEARIRDTDMAKEMMAFTKNNILVQAAQAMLAQANMVPQGILQLLR